MARAWAQMATVMVMAGLGVEAQAAEVRLGFLGLHGVPGADAAAVERLQTELYRALGAVEGVAQPELASTLRRVSQERDDLLDEVFFAPVRRRLLEAELLYGQAEAEAAIDAFTEARAGLDAHWSVLRDPELGFDIELGTALAQLFLDDQEAFERHLAAALQFQPDRQLSPLEYPPQVIDSFTRVRDELRAAGNGSVNAFSDTQMELFVNGRSMGSLPRELSLMAGPHWFVGVADDGARAARQVELAAGASAFLELEAAPGQLSESQEPEGPRSRELADLYAGLSSLMGVDALLLAHMADDGSLQTQIYSASSGAFCAPSPATRVLPGQEQNFLPGYLSQQLDCLDERAGVQRESLSLTTLPVHLGHNPLLNQLLLAPGFSAAAVAAELEGDAQAAADPPGGGDPIRGGDDPEPRVRKPVHQQPAFWVVIGVLAGGGAAAAAIAAGNAPDGDTGIVTVRF